MSTSDYQFEIIKKDWQKRRKPDANPIAPVSVVIPDFKKEKNHMCKMLVTFNDGTEKSLISRVIQNQITKVWTVDGMEVAVKLIEDVCHD